MKILFLIDSLGSGGAQRQVVTLSSLFKDRGLDVSILLYHDDNFFSKEIDDKGILIHYCSGRNHLSRICKVRRFIRTNAFDAVISFLDVPNLLNCISAIGGKTWKVITSERSAKESKFKTLRGKIFGWFQRYSDVIVCNSENAKTMWVKHYPKYKDKISVIYNPVLLPITNSSYIPKSNERINIIVAASYQYLKNPLGVIKALLLLSIVDRKRIKINWYGRKDVSKGDTRAYDEAIKLIEENKLKDVILLNEETSDIINKMNEADFVGLFSELEGLPNAICEGMMIGKPIIMTKVSDYTRLVDHKNGFLCEWDEPESIKNAFIAAMNLSDDQILRMGANSKEKAKTLFSKETIFEQWMKLITGK